MPNPKSYYATSLFSEPTGNPDHLRVVLHADYAEAMSREDAHARRLHGENGGLRAEVERLREALKFYAGTEHRDEWLVPSEEVLGKWLTSIELDGGKRARAALDGEVQP